MENIKDTVKLDLEEQLVSLLSKELCESIYKSISNTIIYHSLRDIVKPIIREMEINEVLNDITVTNEQILNKALDIHEQLVDQDTIDKIMRYIEIKRGVN